MTPYSLNHFKSVFAQKFFIDPADKNYFMARWARIHGFHQEFYWQSLQAIEKYLKANLVQNDISTKASGHNLEELYLKFQGCFNDLALEEFMKPKRLKVELWEDECVLRFVKNIDIQGHPDSRYGLVSWSNKQCDLFKLDQLVFALRRVSIGLEWIVGEDWEIKSGVNIRQDKFTGQTFKTALGADSDLQVRSLPKMPDISMTASGGASLDILHAWNFHFVGDKGDLEKNIPAEVTSNWNSQNSYMALLYERLSDRNSAPSPFLIDGAGWLLDNFHLNKSEKRLRRRAFKTKISVIR